MSRGPLHADTAVVGVWLDTTPATAANFEWLRALLIEARRPRGGVDRPARVCTLGGADFYFEAISGRYPLALRRSSFVVTWNGSAVRRSEPTFRVLLGSGYCTSVGSAFRERVIKDVAAVLAPFGTIDRWRLSGLHLCVDQWDYDWTRADFDCRVGQHSIRDVGLPVVDADGWVANYQGTKANLWTGLLINKRGKNHCQFRHYRKDIEMRGRHARPELVAALEPYGFVRGLRLSRHEWECGGKWLDDRGFGNLLDLKWSRVQELSWYLSRRWLRVVVPGRGRRDAWRMSDPWREVAEAADGWQAPVLARPPERAPDVAGLEAQILGLLASAAGGRSAQSGVCVEDELRALLERLPQLVRERPDVVSKATERALRWVSSSPAGDFVASQVVDASGFGAAVKAFVAASDSAGLVKPLVPASVLVDPVKG